MRIAVVPENLLERVVLASGVAPVVVLESWFSFHLARVLMVSAKLGVFDAIGDGPTGATAAEIAARIGAAPMPTSKLLTALRGADYVRIDGDRYHLRPAARWLLADRPDSVRDKLLIQLLEWDWLGNLEDYVRTGRPLDLHERLLTDEHWATYQRGMRSGIEPMAREVAQRLALPAGATRMLDIGGSHGFYSASFCRRHPSLSAVILDLPDAIRHAAPLLAREGLGDRVVYREGDLLEADLGEAEYDLVLLAAVVHHFDADTNRALVRRAARALRPNGALAILEPLRIDAGPSSRVGQIGGLLDLFFGMTSRGGTYAAAEIADWQRDAGLTPRRPFRLRILRDMGVQAAVKRSA